MYFVFELVKLTHFGNVDLRKSIEVIKYMNKPVAPR